MLLSHFSSKGISVSLTSWYYSGFGTKLSPVFGLAKSSKYKTISQLSQMPKSVVVAVMRWHLFII